MKDSLNTLKELASSVRNATKEGENSAERIGRLFEGILEYIKTPESIENYFELKQDSNGLDYIYTKYNIASAGALSMYASDKINVPSIYDGLPIDNDTIYWHEVDGSKVLKAKGGGGEAGSVQWDNISGKPSWIEDTKPSYSWSDITGEKPFYTKEEIASKYVTIDTEQEITALKHFTAGLSVGESKKKIYEENGVVYIDADVAVTGAMTFYASAGRSVSTIMDGVTVDEETITKGSDNVLRIKNAGAGSSFDENAMWSALSGSSDNQINKSHLTTALEGYATRNWVIENYATKSELSAVSNKLNDFLEGSDTDNIINKWKELEAFLSGMAETDNLAEILETKADKKYVDSTFVTLGTKQTITGEKTFSSVLNTAAIKASGAITAPSLAASDWVTIAGIKLRKLEDGALMLEGNLALTGALTMYASNGQSFDTIYDGLPIDNDTIYWQEVDGSRVLKAREGSGSSFDKSAMWTALAGSTTEQINKSHLTTALNGYATESWVTSKNYLTSVSIATISDLHANWDALLKATPSSYVTRWPTISEVTDRKNLIIKLNGGSTEGTNLFTYNVTGEKTINITPAGIGAAASSHNHSWSNITSGKPSTLSGYGITDAYTKTESDNKYPTKTGSGASGTWGINVTGNAGTATKLQTARSLWGRSFDGTGNVSGNLANVPSIINQDYRHRLDIGGVGFDRFDFYEFGGIYNFYKSTTDNASDKVLLFKISPSYAYVYSKLGIGISSPTKALDVNGSTGTTDLYINGIRLHKTADGVITLEGNLAVTGGVTMYAIDPVSASTIMDGVVVDGVTIKKENGKLVAVGGGEAGNVAWDNISGKPSVFPTNIANITDLHSSWDAVLKAQKPAWLTAVSIATISDLNSGWDALLKAAPSAYVTRWPTISEVTNKQNLVIKLNGGTTEGTNQFTYNATAAKSLNITPAGIGAAASSHSHDSISVSVTGSNNSTMIYAQIADNDYFRLRVGGTASNAGYVEFATADDGNEPIYFRQYTGTFTSVKRTLTLLDGSGNSSFPGTVTAPTFNGNLAWSHITSKPTTLSGYGITDAPTKTGSGASGTWGINISGNASNADKLDGTHKRSGNTYWGVIPYVESDGTFEVGKYIDFHNSSTGTIDYSTRVQCDGDHNNTLILPTRDGNLALLSDNVESASKLQTERKIWGIGFNGTKDVVGNITLGDYDIIGHGGARIIQNMSTGDLCLNPARNVGIGTTNTTYKLEVSGTIYAANGFATASNTIISRIGYTHTELLSWSWSETYGDHVKISIPGTNDQSKYIIIAASTGLVVSGNISIGNSDILGYGNARIIQNLNGHLGINPLNNVGIGTTSPSAKLHVAGDILANGGVTMYSDQRAKTITGLVSLSLKQICEAPTIRFRWNGWHLKDDGRNHIGGIAQYIQGILPETILNANNFLSMDYATVAYTFAVHTARHLLTYETRTDKKIKKLEREIVILKKQLKKLGYEEVRTLDDSGI